MTSRVLVLSTVLSLVIAANTRAEDKVDFEKQIQPIFLEHCSKCHGEKMAAGKMRLHTAAALKEKWTADAHLIVVGKPEESELYERITLPADDRKRMPKKPAPPLPKEVTELIARWIREGAVLPLATAATEPAPAAAEAKPEEATAAPKEESKPADDLPLPEVAAAPQEAIDKLTAAGAQVLPLFAESSLLQISFAHRSEPAGDAEISLLTGVAEQVYSLNLSDAKPTEAGLAPLASLKNLSALHLERSAVTDAGLAHIAGLANLQYLNLYGTGITDEGIKHLAGMRHLRRLYLWQTNVSYDTAMAMEKGIPGLMVNLGYNHPMVVRIRLTKELEVVKKQVEEAKAEAAKAQQQLEGAKKNAEAVNARLADIEKQLKELDADADKGEKESDEAAPADANAEEAKADDKAEAAK